MFNQESGAILEKIYDFISKKPSINLKSLEPNKTALIIIDMINGFCNVGALKSNRVNALIPEIVKLSVKCEESKIQKIAFADSHSLISPEFTSFPEHCLENSNESEVVNDIKTIGGYKLIKKNSTNGFLEPDFQEWLRNNKDINTFIVVGDCTDICINQFAVTLKTHYNRINEKSRIIVPINSVDTYDLEIHNGNLLHVLGLYQMSMNDIEVVKEIIF
ncbi:MAG: amidase [Haloplasmataceae bacterium]|nr:amidase [Haloplasmataceae bacterium]